MSSLDGGWLVTPSQLTAPMHYKGTKIDVKINLWELNNHQFITNQSISINSKIKVEEIFWLS
jgi:hypothetical protein